MAFLKIRSSSVSLRIYMSEKIPVKGELQVQVQYGQQRKSLISYVVKEDGPYLMGRDWLKHMRFNWKEIHVTM